MDKNIKNPSQPNIIDRYGSIKIMQDDAQPAHETVKGQSFFTFDNAKGTSQRLRRAVRPANLSDEINGILERTRLMLMKFDALQPKDMRKAKAKKRMREQLEQNSAKTKGTPFVSKRLTAKAAQDEVIFMPVQTPTRNARDMIALAFAAATTLRATLPAKAAKARRDIIAALTPIKADSTDGWEKSKQAVRDIVKSRMQTLVARAANIRGAATALIGGLKKSAQAARGALTWKRVTAGIVTIAMIATTAFMFKPTNSNATNEEPTDNKPTVEKSGTLNIPMNGKGGNTAMINTRIGEMKTEGAGAKSEATTQPTTPSKFDVAPEDDIPPAAPVVAAAATTSPSNEAPKTFADMAVIAGKNIGGAIKDYATTTNEIQKDLDNGIVTVAPEEPAAQKAAEQPVIAAAPDAPAVPAAVVVAAATPKTVDTNIKTNFAAKGAKTHETLNLAGKTLTKRNMAITKDFKHIKADKHAVKSAPALIAKMGLTDDLYSKLPQNVRKGLNSTDEKEFYKSASAVYGQFAHPTQDRETNLIAMQFGGNVVGHALHHGTYAKNLSVLNLATVIGESTHNGLNGLVGSDAVKCYEQGISAIAVAFLVEEELGITTDQTRNAFKAVLLKAISNDMFGEVFERVRGNIDAGYIKAISEGRAVTGIGIFKDKGNDNEIAQRPSWMNYGPSKPMYATDKVATNYTQQKTL